MAKIKTAKGSKGVPNKHLHSRISYLYQAAAYLTLQQKTEIFQKELKSADGHEDIKVLESAGTSSKVATASDSKVACADLDGSVLESSTSSVAPKPTKPASSGLALQLSSHLRGVSLKGQVRLSRDLKRSICKCCNTILIPGCTSTTTIENQSRGGKKPWADVLVIECSTCGSKKRFPIGSKRQTRKTAGPKAKEGSPTKTRLQTMIQKPSGTKACEEQL